MTNNKDEVFEITNGHCAYCGAKLSEKSVSWHMDHVIPRSKGGAWKGNLIPACPTCNLRKNVLTPDGFRKHIKARALKHIRASLTEELGRILPFVTEEQQEAILGGANLLLKAITESEIHFYMDDLNL